MADGPNALQAGGQAAPQNAPLIATDSTGKRQLWNGQQWIDIPPVSNDAYQAIKYFQAQRQQGVQPSQATVKQFGEETPESSLSPQYASPEDIQAMQYDQPTSGGATQPPNFLSRMSQGVFMGSPFVLQHPIEAVKNAYQSWTTQPGQMAGEVARTLGTGAYNVVRHPIQTAQAIAQPFAEDIQNRNYEALAGDVGGVLANYLLYAKAPGILRGGTKVAGAALGIGPSTDATIDASGLAIQKNITDIGAGVSRANRAILDTNPAFRDIMGAKSGTEVQNILSRDPAVTGRMFEMMKRLPSTQANMPEFEKFASQVNDLTKIVDRYNRYGGSSFQRRAAIPSVAGGLAAIYLKQRWYFGSAIAGIGYPLVRKLLAQIAINDNPFAEEGFNLIQNQLGKISSGGAVTPGGQQAFRNWINQQQQQTPPSQQGPGWIWRQRPPQQPSQVIRPPRRTIITPPPQQTPQPPFQFVPQGGPASWSIRPASAAQAAASGPIPGSTPSPLPVPQGGPASWSIGPAAAGQGVPVPQEGGIPSWRIAPQSTPIPIRRPTQVPTPTGPPPGWNYRPPPGGAAAQAAAGGIGAQWPHVETPAPPRLPPWRQPQNIPAPPTSPAPYGTPGGGPISQAQPQRDPEGDAVNTILNALWETEPAGRDKMARMFISDLEGLPENEKAPTESDINELQARMEQRFQPFIDAQGVRRVISEARKDPEIMQRLLTTYG